MVTHDPVQASIEFDRKLQDSEPYKKMTKTLARRKIVGSVLAAWMVINLVLTFIAINAAINADKALDQQHATCLSGNDYRKQDYGNWLFVINFVDPQPRNVENQRKVDELQQHFKQTDKLRNCEKVK